MPEPISRSTSLYGTFASEDSGSGQHDGIPKAVRGQTALDDAGESEAIIDESTEHLCDPSSLNRPMSSTGREKIGSGTFGRSDHDLERTFPSDDFEHESYVRTMSANPETPAGIQRVEAIATTWSKWSLFMAYLGIGLIACTTSLEVLTTVNLTIYATSDFKSHALISTVLVVQGVVLSVVKPPMSKIADVFGRLEAFILSVTIYVVGYIQQAASRNVETYAAAQIFYSAGQTGLQILIQIFIADTSDLLNRALIVTLPDLPFLVNVWIGPLLANRILKTIGWRWGYGMWAVILPVSFLPLALALCLNQRRAAKRGVLAPSPLAGQNFFSVVRTIWHELDVFGLLLLCAGFSLLLVPLTIGARIGWLHPSIIVMLLVGALCLGFFPFWETNPRLAPRAFFPKTLFYNRTVLAGLAFAFFYFMAFYLSVFPYFQSYLIVVRDLSVGDAGRIVQVFTFAAATTSIPTSLLIKYTRRYRRYVTLGASFYLAGLVLMVFYRTSDASLVAIMSAQALLGIGGGMCHGPAQLGVQASASHRDVAAATAAFLTLLEIGGAIGSAISGAIWTGSVPAKLALYLPPETKDRAADIFGDVNLAANGWPVGSPTRDAINRAYQETMTRILIVAVLVATPCVFLSFLMEDHKLDEIDQHVKGVVIGQTGPLDSAFAASSTSRLLGDSDHDGDFDDEEFDDDDEAANRNEWERDGRHRRREQSIRLQPSRSTLRRDYETT